MDNLVFSNMLHRPARTFISVFGIAIGVLLIVFTIGLVNGSFHEKGQRELNVGAQILIRKTGTVGFSGAESFGLPISDVKDVAKVEGVKMAIPVGQNTVSTDDSWSGTRAIEGINFDEYAEMSGLQIIEGRTLAPKGDETILDTGWIQQKKLKVGDTLKIYNREFKIVGTFEPAAGARIKIPLLTMQEQLSGEGRCTAILVSVNDVEKQDEVAARINAQFPEKYQIFMTRDLEELYANGIPALNIFLNVIIGVAAIVSALVILLTMYTTVTERTRQIGILKALGMSNVQIAWTIAQEAILITFIGVLFGILLTVILKYVLMNTSTLKIQLDGVLMLETLVVGVIGGAIGALYPAIRASRLDAVDALSYE